MPDTKKKKPAVKINLLECKSCGRCVHACPVKCLEIGDTLNARGYQYVVYKGNGCNGCGNCYYSCPEPLAIEVRTD
ncbi:MAG: 4Fe-4S dicluster domain-containing protein [Planctomycetes bacterium]|nr:4Fe-4S dicluster domain-containing protein [Planctomycetota bacterium]